VAPAFIAVAGISAAVGALVANRDDSGDTRPTATVAPTAPTVPATTSSATTTSTPSSPAFMLHCPNSGIVNSSSFHVRFGHSPITTSAPIVRFDIDYGDGQHFTNATEAGVFEHRYVRGGAFTVTAVVTDARGQQGQSSCSFSWRPREVPEPRPTSLEPRAACHPSYPNVCIPPAPPDLNCPDVPYTDFTVLPPDPHGFDGNGDGEGCESY
jgi:hypothetical protein